MLQDERRQHLRQHVKQLLELRHDYGALRGDEYSVLFRDDAQRVLVIQRQAVRTHTARITMNWDLMQWPAMVVTVGASWLLTSTAKRWRYFGFIGFLISNGLWIVWAWPGGAYGVVVMQVCLALLNVRGLQKTQSV